MCWELCVTITHLGLQEVESHVYCVFNFTQTFFLECGGITSNTAETSHFRTLHFQGVFDVFSFPDFIILGMHNAPLLWLRFFFCPTRIVWPVHPLLCHLFLSTGGYPIHSLACVLFSCLCLGLAQFSWSIWDSSLCYLCDLQGLLPDLPLTFPSGYLQKFCEDFLLFSFRTFKSSAF